jgi:hypothetical protein
MKHLRGKLLLGFLVLCFAASVPAQDDKEKSKRKGGFQHQGDIITFYDKAKDETKVELKRMTVRTVMDPRAHTLHLNVYYIYPGKKPSKPKEVVVGFVSASNNRDQKFREARDFSTELDGKKINFGTMELVESRILPGFYKEVLGIFLPFDQFFQIVDNNKDSLMMTVGNVRFEMIRQHMEALRDLASRVEPK